MLKFYCCISWQICGMDYNFCIFYNLLSCFLGGSHSFKEEEYCRSELVTLAGTVSCWGCISNQNTILVKNRAVTYKKLISKQRSRNYCGIVSYYLVKWRYLFLIRQNIDVLIFVQVRNWIIEGVLLFWRVSTLECKCIELMQNKLPRLCIHMSYV